MWQMSFLMHAAKKLGNLVVWNLVYTVFCSKSATKNVCENSRGWIMYVFPEKFFMIPDFVSVREEPAIEKEC